ncbi:MAG: FUSC family protein [Jatrophihabitantaceae bacterium]
MLPALWRGVRARDPQWYALRRAARAAVVVPVNFAIGSQLIANAQVATFAAFGSFALLLFVNFPGPRPARLGAFAVLGGAGVVLISLGTLVSSPSWLAVTAMAAVAFAVLFTGVVSSVINGGTQAALLSFILAVMLPGGTAVLPDRLAGWGIGWAVSVPVAVLVWPPVDRDVLRLKTAVLCRSLAAMLHLEQPPPGTGDSLVAMRRASMQLREAYRTAATRVAALSTGSRLLIRLVDELEWLTTIVVNACADAPEGWPEHGRRLRASAARVLATCGELLTHDGGGPSRQTCDDLGACLAELAAARETVAAGALAGLQSSTSAGSDRAGEFERPLYAAHELGYAVALVGGTVSAIAAADSRSWFARLTGRRPVVDEFGAVAVAQRVATGHLDRHSVWLHNSVRGAIGLALAVLLSRLVDAQNAFWIGLGALSVLRSNALSTGATVARALAGTVAGFAIGAVVVGLLGTDHALLWALLPLVILVAASAPAVISFVAGQAAFTVFTIILFNIIAPAGWRVGVLRVEDVALGCAASLVAGSLFWPRGAGAALGAAYADAYRASAEYLRQSIDDLLGRRAQPAGSGEVALAAGDRLDDALRQYLAERGTKHVPLQSVTTLANGASRLQLAGTAIARLRQDAPDRQVAVPDSGLDAPLALLEKRGEQVTSWYSALADGLDGSGPAVPPADDAADRQSFLEVVLPAIDRCDDRDRATRAEQLLWSGQYLGDVDRLRDDLLLPAGQVAAVRARSWWRR